MSDLRSLGISISSYAQDHDDRAPPAEDWIEVLAEYLDSWDDPHLGPDIIRGKYFMLPIAAESDRFRDVQDPSGDVMLYEHPDLIDGRTNVAYWDGSVRAVNNDELERLLTDSDTRLGRRYRPHEGVTP